VVEKHRQVTALKATDRHIDPALRVLMQTLFYKSSWSQLLQGNVVVGVALVLSLSMNIIQYLHRPEPEYFGMTPDGRLIKLIPLSKPMQSSTTVLEFTQRTISKSFSLDFDENNLRTKLQSLRDDYTQAGYAELLAKMDTSGLIEKIRSRRLVSSAVPTGAAVISKEYENDDRVYTWEIQVPISLTVSGQNERKTYDFMLYVNVQRIPVVDNPRGIAISAVRIDDNKAKIN